MFLIIKYIKNHLNKYFFSILISLILLIPHFFWLFENNFITIFYGLNRSGVSEFNYIDHFKNPIIFLIKQIYYFNSIFFNVFCIIKKFKFSINKKNKKNYLFNFNKFNSNILILATSIITGAKIRTMWMTPFYLFLGTLFLYIFKKKLILKKNIKKFYYIFLFFFILSPSVYLTISLIDETKRTDYPGKEIARLVQNKWDDNFINEIKIVIGDEWSAGNLSYHLYSRPIWINDLKNKTSKYN